MKEDDTSYILVDGKAYPHTHKSVAERDADDVTQANGNAPLEDYTHNEGIDGVASGTKCAAGKDVRCTTYLKEHIDDKHPDAHTDNLLIVCKGMEDAGAS